MKFAPRIRESRWDHALEPEILKKWEEEKLYEFDPKGEVFVIDTPPPYPSGRPWHVGAASHYSQIDMIARAARMMGYSVYFPIGIDRNGLPVEIYTEKRMGVSIRTVPREEFLKLCSKALDELEGEMLDIMKRLGLSGDFEHVYRTDSPEYRALTQATFIELWKRGLIYEANRPNNYCPVCGTTIADAEVVYEELPTDLVYMRFKVKEGGEMVVASTRPELLCACQAVIVNPKDERYLNFHGKTALVPIYGREVKIIPHPSADPSFGSGAVMVCSYGDYEDVRLFRELGLKEIVAIGTDGRMKESAGKYAGMTVEEARRRIVEDLKEMGLVVKIERIVHRVPTCERSKNPIEIIPMKEFYLKQLDFLDELKRMADEMEFHPKGHKAILLNWMDSLTTDWPISRRRYYGTEIPIWYCKRCGAPNLPEPGNYYRPWLEGPPFEKCWRCGGTEFVGESRTFDTWMDSSISSLFISKYKKDEEFFSKCYPATIRPQGKDIVRTWLYYSMLRCYQLTGEKPFRHVWITGYGLDERGRKMSKSKGNVLDPKPIIERYGADAFRLWSASEATLGSDFRVSERRIDSARKFLTKLWNISRFVSSFPIPEGAEPLESDRWILAELSNLINESLDGYRDFNFFIPANRVREFTWNLFASHYIELVKARAYGSGFDEREQEAAWYTLHEVLKSILLLLAPITPFITDAIWRELYSTSSIHLERFPKPVWSTKPSELTPKLVEFNSMVWEEKKRRGLSLKDRIELEVPEELKPFERDLVAMHNLA